MHCNSCVITIEKTLNNISGVNFTSVNLALENVSIEYDDSLSPELFKSILKKSGFDLIIDKNNLTHTSPKKLINKLQLTLCFGIPLLVYSMYTMLNNIEISKFSIYIQFILCTTLMIIGREYHQFGLNAILRLRPDMNSLIRFCSSTLVIGFTKSSTRIIL